MQCYTELVPPTTVTHAVALPFLRADARNLAVVKTSLLQLFNVIDGRERLELVGEYPLAGTVTAVERVKTLDTKTGGEALLLAFRDAKLSLVEWDGENQRISTISIHFYEADNLSTAPFGPQLADCESILTVDPNARCAALKFGAKQLAILPFRQLADDLAADDEDLLDVEHVAPATKRTDTELLNGDVGQTPYKPSFVLPLTALDSSLSHTVHLAFLYEYREPTFAILASASEPSYSLLDERKDSLTYTVYTLDLEQRASTNLITVPKLPSTLWKVVPLPLPVGGALLVGINELVHINQSGKANATAVNGFAKMGSDFGMADQSHLNMKLENCAVELLDPKTGELLLVLQDGSLVTISFQTMGRSISGLNVHRVAEVNGGLLSRAAPSCLSKIDTTKLFIGSEDGQSSLLTWKRSAAHLSRKRSHAQMLHQEPEDDDDEDLEEEDDDLYDAAPDTKKRAVSSDGLSGAETGHRFEIQDTLPAIGPINDVCIGNDNGTRTDKLQLLVASGRTASSRLTCMNRDIAPKVMCRRNFERAKGAWAVCVKPHDDEVVETGVDNLMFVFDGENTKPYDMPESSRDDDGYVERNAPEYEQEGETLEVQTLAGGAIIVQCRRSEIRTYDTNLALSQIIPMVDDETDAEFSIVHLSFCDPYLLVIRDDSSIQILQVRGREIEPLEAEGACLEKKWLSGCIYSGSLTNDNPSLFLLNAEGGMQVLSLPDLQPLFTTPLLPHLPPVLSVDVSQRRPGTREALAELLIANLGCDGITRPYLIVRTALDDVVLYEPFQFPSPTASGTWHTDLRFRKVPVPYIPKYNDTLAEQENARPPPLRSIQVGGYNAVVIPGAPPCLLLKEASSLPKILEVRGLKESKAISTLSPLHRSRCAEGYFTIDEEGELRESQLPSETWYGSGWSVHQVDLGEGAREVRQLSYIASKGMYAVASFRYVDFHFAEEDGRHQDQEDISLHPQIPQYSVHLLSATTHEISHTFEMPYQEIVTSLRVMPLEISENTHEQQSRIVVATASQRGEDMPARGAVTVFSVLDVVPEPDVPDSGYQLHVVSREETRGAITAIAPFAGGFIGTAQGQKIMIRGLKEDGSCLPIAFLDAQCHTSTIKTLNSRGLWLVGDAWKGLWFGGFTEEPYKLIRLGTSPKTNMEVMAAEFLPFDGSLFILIADANMDLHVLQYDPENPKTQNGMRLLHRSTYHVGHLTTTMTLVPSTLAPFGEQEPRINGGPGNGSNEDKVAASLFHILTTTLSGSIGLITPLDESAYRRLSTLQTHLTAVLEHAAGLNPRAYRSIESDGFGSGGGGGRGVVDGSLVRRISELGAARKADVLSRSGADAWSLRSDLEIVGGGGLGYL